MIDCCILLTPLELQSRFGGNPLKIQVSRPQLSPKRNCSPKRADFWGAQDAYNVRTVWKTDGCLLSVHLLRECDVAALTSC